MEKSRRAFGAYPHPGEMARLTGKSIGEIQSRRLESAREFAVEHDVVLVLKGAGTVIGLPDGRCLVNATGNPGMAKGRERGPSGRNDRFLPSSGNGPGESRHVRGVPAWKSGRPGG